MARTIVSALNKLARYLDQTKGYAQAAASELVLHFASPEELACYTGEAYDRNPHYLDRENKGLYGWEASIVAKFFPAAPAKILVGACGGGREMVALANEGYALAGFDPADSLVALTRSLVPRSQLLALETATYEEVLAEEHQVHGYAPYDAVILGWGSLSHLGEEKTRLDLLRELRTLSPQGPILLSWVHDAPSEAALRIRRLLGSLGLQTRDEREGYSVVGGYSRSYTHEEVFALAAATGNCVLHYDEGDYPHAIFGAMPC